MHTQALVALLLAAGSDVVLASVSSTVINGNGNTASTTASTKLKGSPTRRDLQSLFARDPEFEEVMQALSRRAAKAKDVDGMVADIRKGTTPKNLVAAATSRGLVKNVQGFQGKNAGNPNIRPQRPNAAQVANGAVGAAPKFKREAQGHVAPAAAAAAPAGPAPAGPVSKPRGVITGPKGQKLPTPQVVAHVSTTGSYIPPKIKEAIQSSTKFLGKGQYSSNPTAPALPKRDIGGEILHVRSDGAVSMDEFKVLLNSMKRSPAAKKDILATLTGTPEVKSMTADLIKKFAPNTDGKVNFAGMSALVQAMKDSPKAERAVLAAFNKNEQIAKTTVGLFDKWSAPEDIEKRSPDEEFEFLAARSLDHEMQYLGLAERDLEEDDDEVFNFVTRDPEADAEPEFFGDDEEEFDF